MATIQTPSVEMVSGIRTRLEPIVKLFNFKVQKFVSFVHDHLKANPNALGIFAYVFYPAFCSYFISDSDIQSGHLFLKELERLRGWKDSRPFLSAFLNSAIVFLDAFWRQFDSEIFGRVRPGLPGLSSIVISALHATLHFLSQHHRSLYFHTPKGSPNLRGSFFQ
jgi:hypothetical protein